MVVCEAFNVDIGNLFCYLIIYKLSSIYKVFYHVQNSWLRVQTALFVMKRELPRKRPPSCDWRRGCDVTSVRHYRDWWAVEPTVVAVILIDWDWYCFSVFFYKLYDFRIWIKIFCLICVILWLGLGIYFGDASSCCCTRWNNIVVFEQLNFKSFYYTDKYPIFSYGPHLNGVSKMNISYWRSLVALLVERRGTTESYSTHHTSTQHIHITLLIRVSRLLFFNWLFWKSINSGWLTWTDLSDRFKVRPSQKTTGDY